MFSTDAVRFRWASGTRFGRLVVPLVCSTSATSSGSGGAVSRPAARVAPPGPDRLTRPSSSVSARMSITEASAALRASSPPSSWVMSALALVSSM